MDNQQHEILTNNQKQVLLTGFLGDGCLIKNGKSLNSNYYYKASSITSQIIDLKSFLLGDLFSNRKVKINSGFKKNSFITVCSSKTCKLITDFKEQGLEHAISTMNTLGVALWFYDDGSLHKDNLFYNLCTHKYSREIQEDILIPALNKFNIYPKVLVERKKDGREFNYLYIGKHDGAIEVSDILKSHYLPSMDYKIWCSETSREWRKLQVELKSEGREVSKRMFTNILNKRLDKI